jgi:hypothetical protein
VPHAEVAERVDDRVLRRGRGADGARLADALGAQRLIGVGVSLLTSSKLGSSAAVIAA